jgi:hypothetical protein
MRRALGRLAVQTFKPILLSTPGDEPIVLLDPLKVVNDRLFVCSNVAMKQLRDHGIVVGPEKAMRLNPDLVELR